MIALNQINNKIYLNIEAETKIKRPNLSMFSFEDVSGQFLELINSVGQYFVFINFIQDNINFYDKNTWQRKEIVEAATIEENKDARKLLSKDSNFCDAMLVVFDRKPNFSVKSASLYEILANSHFALSFHDDYEPHGYDVHMGKMEFNELEQIVEKLNVNYRSSLQKRRDAGEDKLTKREKVDLALSPIYFIAVLFISLPIAIILLIFSAIRWVTDTIRKK